MLESIISKTQDYVKNNKENLKIRELMTNTFNTLLTEDEKKYLHDNSRAVNHIYQAQKDKNCILFLEEIYFKNFDIDMAKFKEKSFVTVSALGYKGTYFYEIIEVSSKGYVVKGGDVKDGHIFGFHLEENMELYVP